MEKLFYHCGGEIINGKHCRCTCCGKNIPLNETLSAEPCIPGVAYRCVYGNCSFEISLWNFTPGLIVRDVKTDEIYDLEFTNPEHKEKVEKLLVASIYDAGGAINFSGIYPINEDLEKFLEEKLSSGEIKVIKHEKK